MEGTPIDFEVDTGAVYSVLQQALGPLSSKRALVRGGEGEQVPPLDHQADGGFREREGAPLLFGVL